MKFAIKQEQNKSHVEILRAGLVKPIVSHTSQFVEKKPDVGQILVKEEESEEGEVKWTVFGIYAKAMGICSTIIVIVIFTCYHATSIYANFWLTFWTEDSLIRNISLKFTDDYIEKSHRYLEFYGLLGGIQGILVCIYALLVSIKMVHAAGNLHKKMLKTIMRAPMAFFDTTPVGRIINRFSSDIDVMDNTLPLTFRITMNSLYLAISTIIVVSINTPIILAVIVPVGIIYYLIMKFYLPTSRQLKRLESVSRSPVFNHFSETVTGSRVIRAYGMVDRFINESMKRVDGNLVYYYANFSAARWLGVRMELLSNCLVFAAAIFGIVFDLNGAMVGLSISYALQALWRLPNKKPVKEWPQTGDIKFIDLKTRYRPGLDLVLKGITAHIHHNEKVGIIGRTGAGKSSLTLSLFRLVESAGGSILIDGLRIADIGLHDLREKITILPQDPVLFSGSLRMNLDPFDKYSDDDIWLALERAHLKEFTINLPTQLEFQCGEGGQNISVGQRQLATAAVDLETDDLIQRTIHTEFEDCTVLSIAHRINTVLDYDRVMVLDKGKLIEFDSPATLLNDKRSTFYSMAKDAGLVSEESNSGVGISKKTQKSKGNPKSPNVDLQMSSPTSVKMEGSRKSNPESNQHSEVYFQTPSPKSPGRRNVDKFNLFLPADNI
ncbi:hypothetical protein KUTeg_010375, partial [Tegillarca granosa]